jgi:hypothetical protein
MGLFLDKGERGLLVGQTGSGKTQNAIFQLRNSPVFPVIVFDTKIEDAFFGLPEGEDETIDLIESLPDFEKYAKQKGDKMADYILVRPNIHEVQDFAILDEYCRIAYEQFGACTVYFDELYNWHNRGIPVNNFVGLLTRGRSRGKTVLQSTQRPGWISRFCFTESQKFYIHRLIDNRDRKTLDSMVPDFSNYPQPKKFGFYFFEVGEDETPTEYSPVPFEKLDRTKIFKKKWL